MVSNCSIPGFRLEFWTTFQKVLYVWPIFRSGEPKLPYYFHSYQNLGLNGKQSSFTNGERLPCVKIPTWPTWCHVETLSHQATLSQYLNTISRGSGNTAPGNTSWIAFFNSDSKTALGSLESSPHLTAHAFQAYDSWRTASPWSPLPLKVNEIENIQKVSNRNTQHNQGHFNINCWVNTIYDI